MGICYDSPRKPHAPPEHFGFVGTAAPIGPVQSPQTSSASSVPLSRPFPHSCGFCRVCCPRVGPLPSIHLQLIPAAEAPSRPPLSLTYKTLWGPKMLGLWAWRTFPMFYFCPFIFTEGRGEDGLRDTEARTRTCSSSGSIL